MAYSNMCNCIYPEHRLTVSLRSLPQSDLDKCIHFYVGNPDITYRAAARAAHVEPACLFTTFRFLMASQPAASDADPVDASVLLAADGALFSYKFLLRMYLIGIAAFVVLFYTHREESRTQVWH